MNKIVRPLGCMFGGQRRGAWRNRGGACGPKGPANEKRCHQNGPFQQFMKDFGGLPQFAAGNMPFVSDPEQLKSFGENLKKILDPLGIDVSYYVDGMTNAAKDKSKDQPKAEEAKATEAKKKEEEAKPRASTSSTTTKTTTSTTKVTDPAATKETISRSESIMDESLIVDNTEPIVTSKTASSIQVDKAPTSAAEPVELIDLSKSVNPMAPYESAINALKEVSATYDESEAQGPSAPAVDSMMVDDFNLVDIADELKIIKTIETLKSMGYSDDGGWLTRLVSAKGGNINKVLDAISPNRSQ